MTSLRQIKQRIKGVKVTRQITSSMKVVALARLKRLHQAFLKTDEYSLEISRMIRRLLRSITFRQEDLILKGSDEILPIPPLLTGRNKEDIFAVGVITSDDGLSGSTNLQVVEKAKEVIDYLDTQNKESHIFCLGTKGAEILQRFYPQKKLYIFSRKAMQQDERYVDAERITAQIVDVFDEGHFDVCVFVYNKFKSIVSQKPTIEQIIPNKLFSDDNPWQFLIEHTEPDHMKKDILGQEQLRLKDSKFLKAFGGLGILPAFGSINQRVLKESTRNPEMYDYDPQDIDILTKILPQYLTAYVYRVLLETDVCDNSARLVAMDNSTRNATEMLDRLNRDFAKTRQALVTTDLVERSSSAIVKSNGS